MAAEPLAMVVEFRAAPGKVDELRAALLAIVGPSRAEDGCLRYDLHVDREDPDVLAFYEVWASPEAHQAHDRTPHIARSSLAARHRTEGCRTKGSDLQARYGECRTRRHH